MITAATSRHENAPRTCGMPKRGVQERLPPRATTGRPRGNVTIAAMSSGHCQEPATSPAARRCRHVPRTANQSPSDTARRHPWPLSDTARRRPLSDTARRRPSSGTTRQRPLSDIAHRHPPSDIARRHPLSDIARRCQPPLACHGNPRRRRIRPTEATTHARTGPTVIADRKD